MKTLSPKMTLWLVIFLVTIWGINWPLTKLVLPDVPPLLFSGLRTLIGGLILLGFAMKHVERLKWKRNMKIYAVLAVLNIIGYYGLQTIGIGYLPAGLFSTIVFLQPILLGLFSWLWLGEKMNTLKVVGLILGFAGVAVISSGGLEGNLSLTGIGFALASSLCWALGTIYMKKNNQQLDSLWTVTMQLLIGGVVLMIAGSSTESWSDIQWTPSFIEVLLFISLFVIAGGWMVYFKLIDSGEVSTVGTYTFMIPVLSNIFSIWILSESITLSLLIGLVMIACSIALVNWKKAVKAPLVVPVPLNKK